VKHYEENTNFQKSRIKYLILPNLRMYEKTKQHFSKKTGLKNSIPLKPVQTKPTMKLKLSSLLKSGIN
jgi:hypothetical protein